MTPMEFSVRPLAESDLPEWLRLRRALWDELNEDDHKDEMLDIIENSDSQFVAVADVGGGRLAGFLEASIRSHVEDCDTENVGYLEGWFVDEAFRRRGIGSSMVESAERWARQRGCTEMASDAEVNNDVSQQAHSSLGYSETSRLVHLRKEL
jgi:aminoglycoside 6'-N-acetyltransferase I